MIRYASPVPEQEREDTPDAEPSLVDSASPTPDPDARPIIVVLNWREFLGDLARHPASWPLPGWLGLGVVVLARPELRMDGRGFDALFVVALLSATYWLAPVCIGYMTHSSMGMRAPSDTELGCAVSLLRGGALVGLYMLLIALALA